MPQRNFELNIFSCIQREWNKNIHFKFLIHMVIRMIMVYDAFAKVYWQSYKYKSHSSKSYLICWFHSPSAQYKHWFFLRDHFHCRYKYKLIKVLFNNNKQQWISNFLFITIYKGQNKQVDQLDPSGILVEWLNFFGILQPHHCHHSLWNSVLENKQTNKQTNK